MAEATIVFADLAYLDEIEALLPTLALPEATEYRVEPALDYPGQQVAIDLWAATEAELTTIVGAVKDALSRRFDVTTHASDEIDQEILLHRTA